MSVPKVPPEFDKLSTSEKIEYVQQLWERIAEEAESAELTDAQRDELDRRLEVHRENPDETVAWADLREGLRGKE